MFDMLSANRRDLLIAPLLAAVPGALLGDRANASPVDPNMTFTKLPDQIVWEAARNRPPNTVEQALLWGKSSEPGLYYYPHRRPERQIETMIQRLFTKAIR